MIVATHPHEETGTMVLVLVDWTLKPPIGEFYSKDEMQLLGRKFELDTIVTAFGVAKIDNPSNRSI